MISHSRLLELMVYDSTTGIFAWRGGRRLRAGKVAGNLMSCGYLRIFADGRSYMAHRLAWFYITGGWPRADIDHRNGVRTDNRFANLREATRAENLQNQRTAKSTNRTGLLGVQRNRERFMARIQVDGRQIYLGTFDTPEEAHTIYVAAKRRLHPGCTI